MSESFISPPAPRALDERRLRVLADTFAAGSFVGAPTTRSEERAMARELLALREAVTSLQARGTELITEVRALRRRSDPAYAGTSDDPAEVVIARIHVNLRRLEIDALRVIELESARLVVGRDQYGDLDIATDGRDFLEEALQEMLDGSSYFAVRLLQLKDAARRAGR